jgi:transcriptional regulator of acetoin/glycerol metabolism
MSAPKTGHRSLDEIRESDSYTILKALDKTALNKERAVRLPGMDRVTLYRKIKYNLTKDTPMLECCT